MSRVFTRLLGVCGLISLFQVLVWSHSTLAQCDRCCREITCYANPGGCATKSISAPVQAKLAIGGEVACDGCTEMEPAPGQTVELKMTNTGTCICTGPDDVKEAYEASCKNGVFDSEEQRYWCIGVCGTE